MVALTVDCRMNGPAYQLLIILRRSGSQIKHKENALSPRLNGPIPKTHLFLPFRQLAHEIEKAGATIINTGIGWHEARVPTIATMVPR